VYVANIDKKVEREDVRNFFEQLCGEWLSAGQVVECRTSGQVVECRTSAGQVLQCRTGWGPGGPPGMLLPLLVVVTGMLHDIVLLVGFGKGLTIVCVVRVH
jgi:hypothetical protein